MAMTHVNIKEDGFGLLGSEIVRRYTLINKNNASVTLISYGAGIHSIKVPNKNGIIGDVLLGWDDLNGYLNNRFIGRTIGRVTNRICNGIITINDKSFHLSRNDENRHHLNGGFFAFDNINWDSYVLDNQVVMSNVNTKESEGYPGDLLTQIKYSWNDENNLQIIIRASCTQPTPVDISNCFFFNLAGHATGVEEMEKHIVTINADKWAEIDIREKIPTGKIYTVAETPFDLRVPKMMNCKLLRKISGAEYDHDFCINGPSVYCHRFHARVVHPNSGRFMEVYSNQPGLHFSTGNYFKKIILPEDSSDESSDDNLAKKNDYLRGKDGALYKRHGSLSISPQNYPNSTNFKHFPSCILYPGQVYYHEMSLKFGIINE